MFLLFRNKLVFLLFRNTKCSCSCLKNFLPLPLHPVLVVVRPESGERKKKRKEVAKMTWEEASRRVVEDLVPPKKRRVEALESPEPPVGISGASRPSPLRWFPPLARADPLSAVKDHKARQDRVKPMLAKKAASSEKATTSETNQDRGIIFLSYLLCFHALRLFSSFLL